METPLFGYYQNMSPQAALDYQIERYREMSGEIKPKQT